MSIPRPVTRVFGSKARVAMQLLALVPPNLRIWCEVFAGSAALTIAKAPHPSEHINDLNGDVANLFRVLRDDLQRERLIEQIHLTPWSQEEWEICRGRTPPRSPAEHDPVETARRYLVLSWQGLGGKTATRTGWAVDYSASCSRYEVWNRLPQRLADVAARLKLCHVHQRHAAEMVKLIGKREDALLFVDPPYPRGSIDSHGSVYRTDMGRDEHAAFAEQLCGVKAHVIVTMAKDTVYSEVLKTWHQFPLMIRGLRNKVKEERVFINFEPPRGPLFETRL